MKTFKNIFLWYGLFCGILLTSGCAVQEPAQTALPELPKKWERLKETQKTQIDTSDTLPYPQWWTVLKDPALSPLIEAAEQKAPTLSQAIARINQAKASLEGAQSQSLPTLGASASVGRDNTTSGTNQAAGKRNIALNLNWEIDLFGKIAHQKAAASQQLHAKEIEAEYIRLLLQTNIADVLMQYRACAMNTTYYEKNKLSQEKIERLTKLKLDAGFVAPIDLARARTVLNETLTILAMTQGQCELLSNALVALTDLPLATVMQHLTQAEQTIPVPPSTQLALPGTILAKHPSVMIALANADAAYEEIGVAKAARLPSLSLGTLLGSTWLSVAGFSNRTTNWQIGPSLLGALFDGGAGRANVDGATARYQQAIAGLDQSILDVVQNTENTLSQQNSNEERTKHAKAMLDEANILYKGLLASYEVGRTSLFELEETRRVLNNAQSNLVNAQRDRVQSWIALVKSTANQLHITPQTHTP